MSQELKNKRIKVDNCMSLSVKDSKLVFLNPESRVSIILNDGKKVELLYFSKEQALFVIYFVANKGYQMQIAVKTQRATFGNYRYWFVCPKCGKITYKLHLPPLKLQWACRECHRLIY